MSYHSQVLALSGGVGGAKLALGLAKVLAPEQLTIAANTADDFCHLGFPVSPDLDTVMYTLAGLNNAELGWGLANESWQFMDALQALGGETWFRLGDRDIATHTFRRQQREAGFSLSEITAQLCTALNIQQRLIPMTDDPVATQVLDGEQWLDFQDYFVRQQCEPNVSQARFNGIENAVIAPDLAGLLDVAAADNSLKAIIICPSNPFVSVAPILSLPGMVDKLIQARAPVIAVAPIVGGQAIKGPTAKMMQALDMPVSAVGVAEHYTKRYPGLIDGFIIDHVDAAARALVEALGMRVLLADSVMTSEQHKRNLAKDCIAFARQF